MSFKFYVFIKIKYTCLKIKNRFSYISLMKVHSNKKIKKLFLVLYLYISLYLKGLPVRLDFYFNFIFTVVTDELKKEKYSKIN